jgi:uncharacterized Zn finger protein
MGWGYNEWRPYVPVARRKANGRAQAASQAKKAGRKPQPVVISGRKIATTFWGQAWCDNLEGYSDYANRLPRGRTYVCNGSVVDLEITTGRLKALVAGSDTYEVDVRIDQLKPREWKRIKADSAASIDSLMDLLAGRLSDGVMRRLTRQKDGLFPRPKEIHLSCSCPDWATLCKHVAAVLYGVGAHLDHQPELLFLLRGVDHNDLVTEAVAAGNLDTALGSGSTDLAGEDLGAMFGIELDSSSVADAGQTSSSGKRSRRKSASGRNKAVVKKGTAKKKAVKKKQPGKTTAKKATTKKTAGKKKPASTKKVVKKKATRKKAVAKKATKKTAVRKKTAGKKKAGRRKKSR